MGRHNSPIFSRGLDVDFPDFQMYGWNVPTLFDMVYGFYHAKSPNHRLGNMRLFSNHLEQIQVH